MPRLFRVIAYSLGSSNGETSCSSTSVLIPHQVAHLGMSLLGPEFRRDHRAPFSSLTLSGTVVFWSLRRIARCLRSWHSRNLRGGRDRVIDGKQPIRLGGGTQWHWRHIFKGRAPKTVAVSA